MGFVFLAAFGVEIALDMDSVPNLLLLLLLLGETLPKRLSQHALLPGQTYLHLVRVRKLGNHQTASPQPQFRLHIILVSVRPIVLVASHATPRPLLFLLRLF